MTTTTIMGATGKKRVGRGKIKATLCTDRMEGLETLCLRLIQRMHLQLFLLPLASSFVLPPVSRYSRIPTVCGQRRGASYARQTSLLQLLP